MIQYTMGCCSALIALRSPDLQKQRGQVYFRFLHFLVFFSVLVHIPNDIVRANQSTTTMAAMSVLETVTPKTLALVGLTLLVAAWVVQVCPVSDNARSFSLRADC